MVGRSVSNTRPLLYLRPGPNDFTIQSMRVLYWPVLLIAAASMVWTHTHTDEIPIVLGILLIVSAVFGASFPKYAVVTWLTLGSAVPLAETLVHFEVLRAPWTANAIWPSAAFVAYVPALLGTAIGYLIRRSVAGAETLSRDFTA